MASMRVQWILCVVALLQPTLAASVPGNNDLLRISNMDSIDYNIEGPDFLPGTEIEQMLAEAASNSPPDMDVNIEPNYEYEYEDNGLGVGKLRRACRALVNVVKIKKKTLKTSFYKKN